MPEPEELLDYIVHEIAYPKNLTGKKILVTAGPTREALDPVRSLTNHSTCLLYTSSGDARSVLKDLVIPPEILKEQTKGCLLYTSMCIRDRCYGLY